ncbi:hypothetical protein [Bacteroides acidifaciens]
MANNPIANGSMWRDTIDSCVISAGHEQPKYVCLPTSKAEPTSWGEA